MVHRLDDTRNLVDERDGTGDVVEDRDLTDLLPWVRDVLQKLHDRMRDVLESTKMYTFVVAELAVAHVTVVLDDFADVLGRQILNNSEYCRVKQCPRHAPACPYQRTPLFASLHTASSASGSTSGIFVRELREAYESSRAHQDSEEAPFLAEDGACQACLEVGEAFSCLEGAAAFWEGSSSSTTRDKVGTSFVSASRHGRRARLTCDKD